MAAFLWWRSWHDAPVDKKWATVAKRAGTIPGVVSAVAWALMDYASQHHPRGTIAGFDTEDYAVYSGFPEDQIKAVMKAMEDKGITKDGMFVNWDKRQPKREDNSAERVRKFREGKRTVTHDNAPEESRGEESREDKSGTTPSLDDVPDGDLAPYEQVFVEETKLPLMTGGVDRWYAGLNDIKAAGATPEDFRTAIREQAGAKKRYSMNSPASFVTATLNVVARRSVAAAEIGTVRKPAEEW